MARATRAWPPINSVDSALCPVQAANRAAAKVVKMGPGTSPRPISRNTKTSSRRAAPAPPASSSVANPSQPSSVISFHRISSSRAIDSVSGTRDSMY